MFDLGLKWMVWLGGGVQPLPLSSPQPSAAEDGGFFFHQEETCTEHSLAKITSGLKAI